MRRFFIWSALAALLGLALSAAGYAFYWYGFQRFQPATITRNESEVQRLLDQSSWVSPGGGGSPVYIVGHHGSQPMRRFLAEEAPALQSSGAELRIIVYAPPDGSRRVSSARAERAAVAELWLTRNWSLFEHWWAASPTAWTAAGLPSADTSLARSAVVSSGRDFARSLARYLTASGLQADYPLILWRDREGRLKACACSDRRSWRFVREDLGAPDPPGPGVASRTRGAPAPEPLPYPEFVAAPPETSPSAAAPVSPEPRRERPHEPRIRPEPDATRVPSAGPQATAPADPKARPVRPSLGGERPRQSRPPPPEPRQGEDTLFY